MQWGALRTECWHLFVWRHCTLFGFASEFLRVLVSEAPCCWPWSSLPRKGAHPALPAGFPPANTELSICWLVDQNKLPLPPHPHRTPTLLTSKATAVSRGGNSPNSPSPRNFGSFETPHTLTLNVRAPSFRLNCWGDRAMVRPSPPHIPSNTYTYTHTPTYTITVITQRLSPSSSLELRS